MALPGHPAHFPQTTPTRRRRTRSAALAAVALLAASAAACGSDETTSGDDGAAGDGSTPTVVTTTGLLGDVVSNVVGDTAEVTSVLPPNADPHDFQPSAQDAEMMREADVLVVNGADLEEGLVPTIEAAEEDGVTVCVAIEGVDALAGGHDHGGEEETKRDGEEEGHDDEEGIDPHFFTDPARMAAAAGWLTECIADAAPSIDAVALSESSDAYVADLMELDARAEELFGAIPAERRVLVTNHDVFEYLADRYRFEVLGSVLGTGTQEQADAATMAALAETIRERDIPAVFSDASSSDALVTTLAEEAGGVTVVTLYSESLGEEGSGAEDYVGMVTTNVERISEALG